MEDLDISTLPERCKECGCYPLVLLWLLQQELQLTEKQLVGLEKILAKTGRRTGVLNEQSNK